MLWPCLAITHTFDKWAWRWPFVHRFTGHPWVGGTWRAIVTPTSESHIPAGGNRGAITTYLTIEQTYWTLHATPLRTAESASRSDNATIVKTERLRNRRSALPVRQHPAHRAPAAQSRHSGACRLSVTGRTPQSITGSYFTDRYTAGDMDLTLVDRSTDHWTFADAQTADQATAQTA